MSEAAGAEVLEEVILDRRLERMLTDRGAAIGDADVEAERALLVGSLDDDPDVAVRLLEDLRTRRGLGPARFAALLRRNAALRLLIQGRVDINDDAVARMHDVLYGPRRQTRLLTTPTLSGAQHAIARIRDGESFADVAVDVSTDVSASRGGLLAPMSEHDPSYPEAIRTGLWSLLPGELSRPILVEDQYVVLQLDRIYTTDGPSIDDARDDLERRVRLQQERILMDDLARRLIEDSSVTIFDDSLHDSWRRRRAVRE